MKDKKIIILGILAFLAVISLIHGVISRPRGRAARPSANAAGARENTAAQTAATIGQIRRKAVKSKFTSLKRSPFIPTTASGASSSNLILGGIMWDKKMPKAMISNTVVKKGDRIGGYTVTEINEAAVILSDGIKYLELKLNDKVD